MSDINSLITPHNIQGELIKNKIEQNDLMFEAFKEQKYNEHLKENQQLKEQVEELKHIMYVIRDDNGLNHLWCKDMILDWLGSDSK